jgi:hypothetical protein
VLLADFLELIRNSKDVREVLLAVPWHRPPEVALLKVIRGLVLPGEQTTAQRRVSDNGDAELTSGSEDVKLGVLDIEREGRIFDLDSGDGVDGLSTTEGGSGNLREADVLDLPSGHQLGHGTYRDLNGDGGIRAMTGISQIVKVYMLIILPMHVVQVDRVNCSTCMVTIEQIPSHWMSTYLLVASGTSRMKPSRTQGHH